MCPMMTPITRPVLAAPAAFLLSLACGGAQAQTVDDLWRNNCASCHGATAEGGPKAKSMLDEQWNKGKSLRSLFDAVKTGHQKLEDPAAKDLSKLTDAQVWSMINYLHEKRRDAYRGAGGGPKAGADGLYVSTHHSFKVEDVVESGLEAPWSVDFVPGPASDKNPLGGAMLVTEKAGRVRVFQNGKLSGPVTGMPAVSNEGQGGLMDICPHPKFTENGWIYLSLAEMADGDAKKVMTKIVRGHITRTADGWAWGDERVVFQAKKEQYLTPGVHYGSRIVFDPKDSSYLYFTIGERGRQDMAQDLTRPNGKVHRVKDDGSIPQDNPFASNSGPVYKSIWSYGHRNPQGLTFDLEGNLWDTEHGPRGGDELNHVLKGRNYGWPIVTFGINYDGRPWNVPWPEFAGKKEVPLTSDADQGDPQGITMPVHVWLPSIAACGLTVSNGGQFPEWKGDLFAGGLAGQTVQRLRVKDNAVVEREELVYQLGRVRDVVCAPDGAIYLVLNQPDKVVRLVRPPQESAAPGVKGSSK